MEAINKITNYTATKAQEAGEAFAQGVAKGLAKTFIFTIKTTFNATSSLASHTIQIMLPTKYLELYLSPEQMTTIKDGIRKITPWLIKGALFVATGATPVGLACKAFVITHILLDNEYAAGIIGRVLKAIFGGVVAKAEKTASKAQEKAKEELPSDRTIYSAINESLVLTRVTVENMNICNPTVYDAAKKLYIPNKDIHMKVPQISDGECAYLNVYTAEGLLEAEAKVNPFATFRKVSNDLQKKQKKAEPKAEEPVKKPASKPVKTSAPVDYSHLVQKSNVNKTLQLTDSITFPKENFNQQTLRRKEPVNSIKMPKVVLPRAPKGFESSAGVAKSIQFIKLIKR